MTYELELYAPGDVRITSVVASEQLVAGITDYELNFEICDDLWGRLAHITTLDPHLFGDTTDFSGWRLEDEYTTGGETYRRWSRSLDLRVTGGERLGTVGGNPGQDGLDFGVYDRRNGPRPSANPSRWSDSYGYPYARFFVDLYRDGPVRDALMARVNREAIPDDPHPGGYNMQDVPGTAHGAWFHPGSPNLPEDPHLALVWSHTHPSQLVFSIGTSVPTIASGTYFFTPDDDGLFNRRFDQVTPDGRTYGYVPEWPSVTIFIRMPDANTLWIEAREGEHPDPADWVFTDAKVEFVR